MTIFNKSLLIRVLLFTCFAVLQNASANAKKITLQSAGALAFDDANVLFIGDSKAGIVHAYALNNTHFNSQLDYKLGRAQTFEGRTMIDNIDHKIAALLGAAKEDITINDMVVHQPTKQIFLSVHRGRWPDAQVVILKVNQGKLEILNLAAAKHSSQSVGPVPTKETLEFDQPLNNLAITDIDFYKGELFVAGISN